jgi:hypothetical protein
MKHPRVLGLTTLLTTFLSAGAAVASCSIHNDTPWAFVVTSGNTSNQTVGSHTQTHIAAGKIIGKSKEGKTIGGFCKDGDTLEIKNEKGVPILLPKG